MSRGALRLLLALRRGRSSRPAGKVSDCVLRREDVRGGVCPQTLPLVCWWLQKVEEVCAVMLEPPFQSCHEFVSPLSFMAGCSNDLCM